jgi:hypothetical protein
MECRSNSQETTWHFFASCLKWPITSYDILRLDQPPKLLKLGGMPNAGFHRH